MPKSANKRAPRKSPWLKRVLIPFWIIQLLFVTFHLGVQIAASLTVTSLLDLLTMVICFVCIFLDMSEIILLARGTLKPLVYLIFQCVKAGLWFIVFLLTVLGAAVWEGEDVGSDELIMWSVLIEAVVLLTAFVSTLIYASVIYHRHRRSARLALSRCIHDHERSDPFYNGPFSEPRIAEADYSRDQHDSGSPPTYVECNNDNTNNTNNNDNNNNSGLPYQPHAQGNDAHGLLLESGGQEVAVARLSGCRQDLEGDRELFELAACRSVRNVGPLG